MKKVILSLLFVAAGLTAFADPSARVRIAYDGSNVTIRQDADKVSMEAFGTPSIAILVSGTKYAQWQDTNIEGLALEFTPAAENVSFAFSYVIGDLYLVDAKDNSRTKIVDGATYDFTVETAEVGNANAARFKISKVGEPKPIFNNDKLTILGFAGKKVKVDDAKGGVVVAEKTLASDNEEINLSDKSAGRYVVTLDGKEYQIDVKVKDIPEAKYHEVKP